MATKPVPVKRPPRDGGSDSGIGSSRPSNELFRWTPTRTLSPPHHSAGRFVALVADSVNQLDDTMRPVPCVRERERDGRSKSWCQSQAVTDQQRENEQTQLGERTDGEDGVNRPWTSHQVDVSAPVVPA